jgi:hypothetical protein
VTDWYLRDNPGGCWVRSVMRKRGRAVGVYRGKWATTCAACVRVEYSLALWLGLCQPAAPVIPQDDGW